MEWKQPKAARWITLWLARISSPLTRKCEAHATGVRISRPAACKATRRIPSDREQIKNDDDLLLLLPMLLSSTPFLTILFPSQGAIHIHNRAKGGIKISIILQNKKLKYDTLLGRRPVHCFGLSFCSPRWSVCEYRSSEVLLLVGNLTTMTVPTRNVLPLNMVAIVYRWQHFYIQMSSSGDWHAAWSFIQNIS